MSQNFENISPRANRSPSTDNKQKITRRELLLRGASIGASALITGSVLDRLFHDPKQDTDAHEKKDFQPHQPEQHSKKMIERDHVASADYEVIGKTFTEQIRTQDHITLDPTTKKAIYAYWREKFSPGKKEFTDVIIAGLARMRPWAHEIRQQFIQENVPEEYMFLALAESHFLIDAKSDRDAIGPYQIMQDTATLPTFDMTITTNYDERRDPIASARLCARHLRSSYEKFGNNWDLALMDYNGGITNLYLAQIKKAEEHAPIIPRDIDHLQEGETLSHLAQKYDTSITLLKRANGLDHASLSKDQTEKEMIANLRPETPLIIPQEREEISLENFNTWLETHINAIIAKELQRTTYIVQPGDTLSHIATQFSIDDPTLLITVNNITDDTIRAGQELYIPEVFTKKRDRVLKTLSSFSQNINYPEKFYAIRDIIKEHDPHYLANAHKEKNYHTITLPKHTPHTFTHRITRGETLSSAAQQITRQINALSHTKHITVATTLRMLELHNKEKIGPKKIVRPGDHLSLVMEVEKKPTLYDIAQKYHTTPEKLQEINPAVLHKEHPIPQNISIRIPK